MARQDKNDDETQMPYIVLFNLKYIRMELCLFGENLAIQL